MAYKAWCDTAAATKWWVTGTGSTVNRLSEVMDDNPAGVEEDDNPGNYQPWTTFMTEVVEDADYWLHLNVEFGDGVITTYLASEREYVKLKGFSLKNNTTVRLGEKVGDYAINGSWWDCTFTGWTSILSPTATLLLYDSRLTKNSSQQALFNEGTIDIIKSKLSARYYDTSAWQRRWGFTGTVDVSFDDVDFTDMYALLLSVIPTKFTNVHVHRASRGIECQSSNIIARGLNITECGIDIATWTDGDARDITAISPVNPITTVVNIGSEDSWAKEAYIFNIHIRDKDGVDIENVTCLLEDKDNAEVFSVSTNGSGVIAEQTVDYKKWTGTAPTLTEYTPHKLTLSKNGYKTLIIPNITVDEDKDLEYKLLPYGRTPV